MQQLLQSRSGYTALLLEGVDPPKRSATNSNVTVLLVACLKQKGKTQQHDLTFILATSRLQKKKDRERDCAKDILECLEAMEEKHLCRLSNQAAAKDLKQIEQSLWKRFGKVLGTNEVSLQLVEPTAVVLTSWQSLSPEKEPEDILERFAPGCGELLREAKRVSGIVRQQWFLSLVNFRSEKGLRSFTLGAGLATDATTARSRALVAADLRVSVIPQAVFRTSWEVARIQ